MRKTPFILILSLAAVIAAALTGCEDQISNVGASYYTDTVEFHTSVRVDTGFMQFTPVSHPSVPVSDTFYNLTYSSPMMIIGRSNVNDNVESWGVVQFAQPLSGDSVQHIKSIRLLLKAVPYKYGDTLSSHADFQVFEAPPGNHISYSTTKINLSDLSSNPIGTVTLDNFVDSTDSVIAIPLDTSLKSDLAATSLGFVVRPGSAMTNCLGFGTADNADLNSHPTLEYTLQYDTTTIVVSRTSVLDMHVVTDNTVTPPGEFILRGSLGKRELVTFNLQRPNDTAQLNAFSTINNAVLVLHSDAPNCAHSNLVVDTGGPLIVRLTNANDTGSVLWVLGYHDPSDPTVLRFQIRTLIEYWLRNPTQNFGLELRAGDVLRTFSTTNISVEDNTINRWTFYGQDYSDATKRPQLILSYSRLHQ